MNKREITITLIIISAIFAGVIFLKNYYSYKIPNRDMGLQAVVACENVDTLFLGSSAFRKGIDMEMIVKSLPGFSYMVTYNGNEPFNIYVELKELIKENVNVKRLVIDFNPSMMDKEADISDKRLLWDISMDGKREIWREIAKNEDTDFFDFYDYWVLSNNDFMLTYPISQPLMARRYYYGGSLPAEESPGKTYQELDCLPIIEQPDINELQRNSIVNIIKLCKENNIEVIFLESPRYITMSENENYKNKSKELKSIIDRENVACILTEDIDFDNANPEYYTDLTHMSSEGKKEFTKAIIVRLDN